MKGYLIGIAVLVGVLVVVGQITRRRPEQEERALRVTPTVRPPTELEKSLGAYNELTKYLPTRNIKGIPHDHRKGLS